MILTNQLEDDYPNSKILSSKESNLKDYSNIEEISNHTISKIKNTKKTKCFKLKSNNILIQ